MTESTDSSPQPDRTFGSLGPGDSLVAIGAHFDDVELACGGVLAGAAKRGCAVTMLVLTSSQYTHVDGRTHRSSEMARAEGEEAAAKLGVTDVRCCHLSTQNLEWNSETVDAIEAVLVDVKPVIVLTHWSFDTHQDHHYGALATFSAARYLPSILSYDPIFPSGRSYHPFRPQVYVDITDTLEAKVAALRCHRTELGKYGEQWLEAVTARARLRGYETGVPYAEAFDAVRLRLRL